MPLTSIGDMSLQFNTMRQTTQIKTRLGILTGELSSGVAYDLTAHLGADAGRLSDVDRRLSLIAGYGPSGQEAGQFLGAMQTTLQGVEAVRGTLAQQLVTLPSPALTSQLTTATETGRAAFDTIARALNTRLADRSLFSGTATDRAALADPAAMLASLSAAVAGSTTASDVQAAVDSWFDSPVGGFATMAYQGDTGAALTRRIDTDTTVTLNARADDPALRNLLKAAATAALAGDIGLALSDDAKAGLLRGAGLQMLAAAQPLVEMQARLGLAESTVEQTNVRQTAQKTAYGIMRNDLVSADPYDTAAALQQVQQQLETHFTLTARLSRLSLVEYI